MNRAIDTATAGEGGVGCVDDRVDHLSGEVATDAVIGVIDRAGGRRRAG